jgi:small subunit ribosomal protein S14
MKYLNERDYNKRKVYKEKELERKIKKSIGMNLSLNYKLRKKYFYELDQLNKNSSKVRIRNRCIYTTRGRGVYKKWKMCRQKIYEFSRIGKILGIMEATW